MNWTKVIKRLEEINIKFKKESEDASYNDIERAIVVIQSNVAMMLSDALRKGLE